MSADDPALEVPTAKSSMRGFAKKRSAEDEGMPVSEEVVDYWHMWSVLKLVVAWTFAAGVSSVRMKSLADV